MTLSQIDFAPPADLAPAVDRRLILAEGRSLVRLALPIMLIALVNMGMSITDAAMVSVLFGADALAAVAVGSDLYSILFYLGAGTLAGLSPFYAAAVVRADPTERVRLERIGQVAVALLAAVLVPVLWTAPDWLGALGLDPALLDQGRGYTQVMALTLVPMLGVAFYRTILTAAEKPKVFLWVTLAMLPVNAAANYVLMTGAGPAPDFGPTGAALATLLVATTEPSCPRAGRPPQPAARQGGIGRPGRRLARPRVGAAGRFAHRRSPRWRRSGSFSAPRSMPRRSAPRTSPRTPSRFGPRASPTPCRRPFFRRR